MKVPALRSEVVLLRLWAACRIDEFGTAKTPTPCQLLSAVVKVHRHGIARIRNSIGCRPAGGGIGRFFILERLNLVVAYGQIVDSKLLKGLHRLVGLLPVTQLAIEGRQAEMNVADLRRQSACSTALSHRH
jgi:hypothetical protein